MNKRRSAPTAEQLKQAALGNDFQMFLAMTLTDIITVQALHSAANTVMALKAQAEQLQKGNDEIAFSVRAALVSAEETLDRAAEAAHQTLKIIVDAQNKRRSARFN